MYIKVFDMYKEIIMYIKEFDMYKEKIMYIKEFGTYTVREAHDRLRNSRKNEFGFIVQIGSIMEKDVSFVEKL